MGEVAFVCAGQQRESTLCLGVLRLDLSQKAQARDDRKGPVQEGSRASSSEASSWKSTPSERAQPTTHPPTTTTLTGRRRPTRRQRRDTFLLRGSRPRGGHSHARQLGHPASSRSSIHPPTHSHPPTPLPTHRTGESRRRGEGEACAAAVVCAFLLFGLPTTPPFYMISSLPTSLLGLALCATSSLAFLAPAAPRYVVVYDLVGGWRRLVGLGAQTGNLLHLTSFDSPTHPPNTGPTSRFVLASVPLL